VMFFRRSMPRYVQWIVWLFIVAIAAYSFFINWEYAAHYQSTELILQPTGATVAVYDSQGMLHYVPVMRADPALLFVNPLLASGFTVFSLIYSIVAEFFGTKAPTVQELQARKTYLEETQGIEETIRHLEGKHKAKSLLQRAKETVQEGKEVWRELRKPDKEEGEAVGNSERNIGEWEALTSQETSQGPVGQFSEEPEETGTNRAREMRGNEEEPIEEFTGENVPSWLVTGGSTISLQTVTEHAHIPLRTLRNRVGKKEIRATRNKEIVYKASLVEWMKAEGLLKETELITAVMSLRKQEHPVGQAEGNAAGTLSGNEEVFSGSVQGTVPDGLGFIEQQMYTVLLHHPEELTSLLAVAETQPLEEFTAILKAKYPDYADYLTPQRVGRVLEYTRGHAFQTVGT